MIARSELAMAPMRGAKNTRVIAERRGFGCIKRLQMGTGGVEFNNLLDTTVHEPPSHTDFAAHAGAMGAVAHAGLIEEQEFALARARDAAGPFVVVIDTDRYPRTGHGGGGWRLGVPEVSDRPEMRAAGKTFKAGLAAWGG